LDEVHLVAQTPSEQMLPLPHCKVDLQALTGMSQLAKGSPVIPGGHEQNGLWFWAKQIALTPHWAMVQGSMHWLFSHA